MGSKSDHLSLGSAIFRARGLHEGGGVVSAQNVTILAQGLAIFRTRGLRKAGGVRDPARSLGAGKLGGVYRYRNRFETGKGSGFGGNTRYARRLLQNRGNMWDAHAVRKSTAEKRPSPDCCVGRELGRRRETCRRILELARQARPTVASEQNSAPDTGPAVFPYLTFRVACSGTSSSKRRKREGNCSWCSPGSCCDPATRRCARSRALQSTQRGC